MCVNTEHCEWCRGFKQVGTELSSRVSDMARDGLFRCAVMDACDVTNSVRVLWIVELEQPWEVLNAHLYPVPLLPEASAGPRVLRCMFVMS